MNWLDILMLVITALFVFEGLRQGFARLAIGIASTIVGLLAASWLYGTAGSFLLPYVSARAVANVCGFLLVFFGIQAAGALLGWAISKVFKWSGLGWLDRLLGAAMGILKAALVGVVLVMALMAFPIKAVPASVAESVAAPYLVEASHILVYLAPRELKDGFIATYDRLKRFWSGEKPGQPARGSA